ncbi:MAG: type II secretion system protein [Nitrospirota bacterium]
MKLSFRLLQNLLNIIIPQLTARVFRRTENGFTLIELLITIAIMFILTSVAMPITRVTIKRAREIELRRDLRMIRDAIDQFKKDWDERKISHLESGIANEDTGYPKELEILVEDVPTGDVKGSIKKYLRRIPVDPMTNSTEWGLRCYRDEPDSSIWCGEDVYDVYTTSEKTALDGTQYNEW